MNTLPHIILNECFGPTIQGEGLDTGKPCFFIRTQGCPVQCPGCDTFYTWDGTEKGEKWQIPTLVGWAKDAISRYPRCGFVISGGEPLLHYKHEPWREFLMDLRSWAPWISLETSGFVGPKELSPEDGQLLASYATLFTTVHCSPKVTPCLRGPRWTDSELDCNIEYLRKGYYHRHSSSSAELRARLAFKYVVRDEDDVAAALAHVEKHQLRLWGHPLYFMPYGVTEEEVKEGCLRLVPWCAQHGFSLSPRLHSLLWGKKRGV